jgi:radical SAM superfamily enzyme YgiQ (UPF0313 family)
MSGHTTSVIHLKTPKKHENPFFLAHPISYENHHSFYDSGKFKVSCYNYDAEMWTNNEIGLLEDAIKITKPDLIALSTRSSDEKFLPELIAAIRRVTDALTLAGGFGATLNPEKYMNLTDFVCIGEGEETIVKLAERHDIIKYNKEKAYNIPNIAYVNDGKIHKTQLNPPMSDKDYFYYETYKYIEHLFIDKNDLIRTNDAFKYLKEYRPGAEYYTMIGRGCIGHCTFCAVSKFRNIYFNKGIKYYKRRSRSYDNLFCELESAKAYGFRTIFFMDSFLLAPIKFLVNFFQDYKKRITIPFFAQFNLQQIINNPAILKLADEAGLIKTVIGIQAVDEKVNRDIFQRKDSYKSILEGAKLIGKHTKALLDLHVITHNPFEKASSFKKRLSMINALPRTNTQIVLQRLRPFPGTVIYDIFKKNKLSNHGEEYDIEFIFYLLRFNLKDADFKKVYCDHKHSDFITLRKFYDTIMCNCDCNQSVKLLNEREYYNILKVNERFVALLKSLGEVDLNNERLGERDMPPYAVLTSKSLKELEKKIRDAEDDIKERSGSMVLFLEENSEYNILKVDERFVAVLKSLGEVDLSRERLGQRDIPPYAVLTGINRDEVTKKIHAVKAKLNRFNLLDIQPEVEESRNSSYDLRTQTNDN